MNPLAPAVGAGKLPGYGLAELPPFVLFLGRGPRGEHRAGVRVVATGAAYHQPPDPLAERNYWYKTDVSINCTS